MIEIEKNVPMPANYGKGRNSIYPWRTMEVGDSFFVADKRPSDLHVPPNVRSQGWKFTSRSEQNGKERGVRVWRIA